MCREMGCDICRTIWKEKSEHSFTSSKDGNLNVLQKFHLFTQQIFEHLLYARIRWKGVNKADQFLCSFIQIGKININKMIINT